MGGIMAKDDYFVIVYKVLIYLYGCLKRKISFSNEEFESIAKNDIPEEYFEDVLQMMNDEGYIKGYVRLRVWGGEIITMEYSDIKITQKGIEYLCENSMMQKSKKILLESTDIVGKLIKFI